MAWQPTVEIKDDGVWFDGVEMFSFRRTIRVPDSQQLNDLPPNLGRLPLYRVADYASRLPKDVVAKGGLFMPMYQKEAMWINFETKRTCAVKIYVGGVNAISGEPMIETSASLLRRRNQNLSGLQDYVILPHQHWLDGIAVAPGKVRQFVASPMGSGQSIEAQITGEEATAGLQFEIIPIAPPPIGTGLKFESKTHTGQVLQHEASPDNTVGEFYEHVSHFTLVPTYQMRMIFAGGQFDTDQTLAYYNIQNGSPLYWGLRLRGGARGPDWKRIEMNLAAGGKIKQEIVKASPSIKFDASQAIVFNA